MQSFIHEKQAKKVRSNTNVCIFLKKMYENPLWLQKIPHLSSLVVTWRYRTLSWTCCLTSSLSIFLTLDTWAKILLWFYRCSVVTFEPLKLVAWWPFQPSAAIVQIVDSCLQLWMDEHFNAFLAFSSFVDVGPVIVIIEV